jgi:gliding motility-associated-like protein
MKKTITLLAQLALPLLLFAQAPVNDDCAGLIDLGVAPACTDSVYTNVDATSSDIGFGNIPSCFQGGAVGNDVWFAFTSSDTILDYTITVEGVTENGSDPILNPQVALYRGDCTVDGLAELACASADPGSNTVELDISGLTINVVYFLRISDFSATGTPNSGTFRLCVEETPPATTIDQGGSTDCSGILFDSGGEEGDYGNDEDFTFTICPDNPPECLIFTLDYYFIENNVDFFSVGDELAFFDGETADPGNFIASVDGFDFSDEGGGAVCYRVKAESGCMTIRFTSDATNAFQGFAGHWECSDECEDTPPITVNTDISEQDIVDFVATPITTAEIASINCPDVAYGTFEAAGTDLGLESGLLMTTGRAVNAIGPNLLDGSNPLGNNFAPGDPDLDYLSQQFGNGLLSQDACVIELDVFVTADELTFEYIFGSDEYPEYVNDNFNDIFAFLISGPGIDGDPNINNQRNIATIPSTDTPVQINSLNNLLNWEYYLNNENSTSVEYDGLTTGFLGQPKNLIARSPVIPCNTYRLKLAIADRGDGTFDSGVFISNLRGGTPELSVNFPSGLNYLVEGCVDSDSELLVTLDEPAADSTSYIITLTGTATNGEDYILNLPDSLLFIPGQSQLSFPITVLSDMAMEGLETIVLTLSNDFGCGEVVYTELTIELQDEIFVDIESGRDTVTICADSTRVLMVEGATTYFWSPPSLFDEPTSSMPTVSVDSSQWVFVEGAAGVCSDADSIFLLLVDPFVEIEPLDPTAICEGDSVRLQVNNNLGLTTVEWTPTAGLSVPDGINTTASPDETTDYIVNASISGCSVQDTLTVDVTLFDVPQAANDTTICENFSVLLGEDLVLDTITTAYEWTPAESLDNDTITNPLATPASTTTYQLTSTSLDGFCVDNQEVTVTVTPADVAITNGDTLEICLGTTVDLVAQTTTGTSENLLWSPNDGSLSDTTGLTVQATPEVSTWYFADYALGECAVVDSIFIRVDSLPFLDLMADPDKEVYCQGDIVVLTTEPIFEPSDYPDIEHQWIPGVGQESPDSLWNLVITAQDTITYQRITVNRACIDTASITINVIEPPQTTITPSDTTVCFGDAVDFTLEIFGDFESFEWMGEGLSCTDCFTPTANPAAGSYTVEIEYLGCNTSISANVNAIGPPDLELNTQNFICPGVAVELNLASSSNATYSWTSPDSDFTSNEPQPVVNPTETTTYEVVADNGICPPIQDSLTIEVVEIAEISEITASENPICRGEELTLSVEVSNVQGADRFEWTAPDGSEIAAGSDLASISFPVDQSGTYTLTFISSAGCGVQTRTIDIQVLDAPVVDLIDDAVICLGDEIQLNLDSDDGTSYSWTSSTDPAFSSTDPNLTVSPTETTTYTLVATSGSACPAFEGSVTITVATQPSLMIDAPEVICLGEELSIIAIVSNDVEEGTYSWTNESTGEMFEGSTITVAPEDTSTYSLIYTSGTGCFTLSGSVTVNVAFSLDITGIDIVPDTSTYIIGDVVDLTALYDETLPPSGTFFWVYNETDTFAIGEGLTQTQLELLDPLDPTTITVFNISPDGCVDEFTITITVEGIVIAIPNAFTPNNDDQNDFFNFISNAPDGRVEATAFQVYNRWGQLVYDNDTPDTGWDGTFNGNVQPSEVYYYNIQLIGPNGDSLGEFQGDVTLVR